MSLLPLNTLSEAGCLFIEARLLGGPGSVVSQIGLTVDAPNTSIAVFSRTSGVLLVAGVGSFFAYRVASNFLGNRFVWECMEARRLDQIPTADRRLLYSFNEEDAEEDAESDAEEPLERRRHRRDSAGSRVSVGQVSIGRLNRVRRSTRAPRGLLGSLQEAPRRGPGIVSRQSSRQSVGSAHSVVSIPFSSASSVKSASFRIVWEGSQPSWDDFDVPSTSSATQQPAQPSVLSRLGHVASTSSMRRFEDGQSVGDLCSVFNDVMSVTSLAEGNDDPLLDDEFRDEDEELPGGLWRKCTTDSNKYMYQSFAIEPSEEGSEQHSEVGSPMRRQFLNFGIATEDKDAEDVTLLLSPPESSDSMPRSQNSKNRSMYDSAIGADISSSEEGSTCHKRLFVLQESDNMSVVAPSCASLEWCDDIARNDPSRLGFEEEQSPLRLRRANLDWDLESEVERAPLSIASSSMTREVETRFAPKSSRDLMVMACEMFQPYSPPFRDLQTIYHKRRLKRIAVPSMPESESTVSLFMRSALYHKCSLLRDATWQTIEKRFDNALHECDFMSKWPGYEPKAMRRDLKELHELASSIGSPSSSSLEDVHLRAYHVMMVLEAKRAYDERLAGLFCENWFDVDSPADVFKVLSSFSSSGEELPPKILWNILCRISGVSIEILDARSLSERPSVSKFSSSASPISAPSLMWLRLGRRPVPLFYIPDDE